MLLKLLRPISQFFDAKRALLAAPLVLGLIATAYFLLERDASDGSIQPARLLATAMNDGRNVGLEENDQAPDFELSTSEGQRLRLSELRGRPVLVNFWATWCGSCLSEMPEIKALQEEKGLDAFAVLAVNAGETLPEARRFIDFLQAPFIYGLDPGLVVSDAYGVYGLPLSVFIDSEGVVRATYNGHANRQRLEAYTNAAINAVPPGPVPNQLKLISTVPRERVLRVVKSDKGRLEFTSRSLRCDAGYCAGQVVETLKLLPGVTSVRLDANRADPKLSVQYAGGLSEKDVIDALARVLGEFVDPVYTSDLEVRDDRK